MRISLSIQLISCNNYNKLLGVFRIQFSLLTQQCLEFHRTQFKNSTTLYTPENLALWRNTERKGRASVLEEEGGADQVRQERLGWRAWQGRGEGGERQGEVEEYSLDTVTGKCCIKGELQHHST